MFDICFKNNDKKISLKLYTDLLNQYLIAQQKLKLSENRVNFLTERIKSNVIASTYYVEEELYAIYIKYNYLLSNNISAEIDTICIDRNILVCNSSIKIYNNNIFIQSIDTVDGEERNGHASKQISIIKNIAKSFERSCIKGEIWEASPIGIENLIKFYQYNDFNIDKDNLTFDYQIKI